MSFNRTRLTTFLQHPTTRPQNDYLTQYTTTIGFHDQLLSKINIIQKSTTNNDVSSAESFLWSDYVKDLPIKLSNDKLLHQQFAQLQKMIQNWCSEEAVRYLGSFIGYIYHNIGPILTIQDSFEKKHQLETTLGPINIDHWNTIYDLVTNLYTTRTNALKFIEQQQLHNNANGDKVTSTIIAQQLQLQQDKINDFNGQIDMDIVSHDIIQDVEVQLVQLGEESIYTSSLYQNTKTNSASTTETVTNNVNTNNTTKSLFSSLQPFITEDLTQIQPDQLYTPRTNLFTFIEPTTTSSSTSSSTTIPQSTLDTTQTTSSPIGTYFWLLDLITAITHSEQSNLLVDNVISLMKSKSTDDELQGDLLDLLGFEAFELISTLLTHRKLICIHGNERTNGQKNNNSKNDKNDTTKLSQQEQLLQRFHKMSSRSKNITPIPTKKGLKVRNISKDFAQHDKLLSLLTKYRQQGVDLQTLQYTSDKAKAAEALSKIPHTKKVTPFGDEISIPPPKIDQLPEEKLIPIVDGFHPRVQCAFGPILTLNTLQTKVYPSAYNSNANMLVCAPTGAGKTNVALMTVLQQVVQYIDDVSGVINKNEFKIIYIAPMKALAAEVAEKFTRSLQPLGLQVRELTGDMQLTKKEILETQMIVTTPEKWDVVTRKSNDGSLLQLVKLLIIDEIHLLHEDRGPVLETIVARTHRHIETSQSMCRIVGFSATLPNYRDVAQFLAVNDQHLHFFDSTYRPVPLHQCFYGIRESNPRERIAIMNKQAFDIANGWVHSNDQVMVFVHARRDTVKTAQYFIGMIRQSKVEGTYIPEKTPQNESLLKEFAKISNSNEVRDLVRYGIGIHHAGLTRAERNWMEKSFKRGFLKLLICTSTLAWGVNLPAHAVILKGTELYDPKRGGFVDVSMLDVNQIFGRAGRPQFDTEGFAYLITTHDKIDHYTSLLTNSMPIESQMIKSLPDHLNAEIILGTVTNLREADVWLTYTYLYTRMLRNPTNYGISLPERDKDPMLNLKRRTLITNATKELMKCKMVKFDLQSGNFYPTDIGRVASLYYIHHNSIEMYNELLKTYMTDEQIFDLIAHSKEFENLQVRDEEEQELSKILTDVCIYKPLSGMMDTYIDKANVLLQCYISNFLPTSSTLQSDQYFIQQSADRIIRALFEMVLRRGKAALSCKLLDFCKMINHRIWPHQHILRQFIPSGIISAQLVREIERAKLNVEDLLDLAPTDICQLLTCSPIQAKSVLKAARNVPWLYLQTTLQPLTRDVIRINIDITCQFEWNSSVHGETQFWWIWIESPEDEQILHHEQWICTKQMCYQDKHFISFTIPISEPLPTQYILRAVNDTWLGTNQIETISFHDILLPQKDQTHPQLLPLHPIPTTSLHNPRAIQLFKRFTHFNPVQTQAFHSLYHTDYNILLGAPTGSGKTVICELAMLRALSTQPGKKIIYIAPMKALVRERYLDWSSPTSFMGLFGCAVLELTGDTNPDVGELNRADIVITSPEKIDGLTRSWQTRDFIKNTCLIIIDEIHLLGQDRGPVLEVLVSRMRYITALQQQHELLLQQKNIGNNVTVSKQFATTAANLKQLEQDNNNTNNQQQEQSTTTSSTPTPKLQSKPKSNPIRFIGLSTAMSNAQDIADWLNIPPQGLFNFHPSVRPVPLTTYIAGFPGRAYCPRNATMNKPCYAAITTHSPIKPVLIFVSSRRQTRLTALDLITLAASDGKSKQWLHMDELELDEIILPQISDNILKHCLSFGIGLHHAGLIPKDREIVESLFIAQKIQILVATSVVAWGVNYPAHLVIVKDVQYYDTKTFKYVDYQITDVLQMIGRSGRPQFDSEGKAVVLCQDSKKAFFQKFLHSPFPIESSLHKFLHNHLNAEIAQGAIQTLNDAIEWLSWTFFFRRLLANPTYYGLPSSASTDLSIINEYILRLLHKTIDDLVHAACVTATISPNGLIILQPTSLGQLAALYYIDYRTAKTYWENLHQKINVEELLMLVSSSHEFWEVPVRHNEDQLNTELMKDLYYPLDPSLCGNPHTKTNILFQARLLQLPLPISDYQTDTQSVLAQSARMFSCLIDILGQTMWYNATCNLIYLYQMMVQGHFIYKNCEYTNIFILLNTLLTNNNNNHREQQPTIFTTDVQQILCYNWNVNGIHHIVQLLDLTFDEFIMVSKIDHDDNTTNNNNNGKVVPKKNNNKNQSQNNNHNIINLIPQRGWIQLYNIIQSLPKINLLIEKQQPDVMNSNLIQINIELPPPPQPTYTINEDTDEVIELHTNEQQQLLIPISIQLQRVNSWIVGGSTTISTTQYKKPSTISEPIKIMGPNDVKTTKEGWFVLLSTTPQLQEQLNECNMNEILENDLLLVQKHISINMNMLSLELYIDLNLIKLKQPNFIGFQPGMSLPLRLTLMSDCYIGFDQQYDFIVNFLPSTNE